MANNKFKNIPFLKNLDMDDPKDKRKAMIFFIALVLVTALLFLNIDGKDREGTAVAENLQQPRTDLLEVPEGHDNDILGSQDMVAARESGRRPNNKDLYEGTVESLDPLGDIFNGEQTTSSASDEMENPLEKRRRNVSQLFGFTENEEDNARSHPQETSDSDRKAASSSKSTAKTTTTTTTRRPMADPAKNPSAPTGTANAGTAKTATTDSKSTNKDNADNEKDMTTIQVKRSGSISSVDDGWGNVQGLSSLDTDSRYIEQDIDHPYKVAFTADEKISSGSKIILRLLEDMYIEDVFIPKNSRLTATCTVNERLNIAVGNIEINGRIVHLGMTAYDNDGSPGLYCPTTEGNTKARSAATTATSALGSAASMMMGTIGAAARTVANIGATAVTGQNKVTVTVNSGYVFYLLKDIN